MEEKQLGRYYTTESFDTPDIQITQIYTAFVTYHYYSTQMCN